MNGTTAIDSSGNGFAATYIGSIGAPSPSTLVPPGGAGNPLSRAFDADARHAIRLAPAPEALKPALDLSISFWFRTRELDFGHNPPAASDAVSLGDNYFVRLRATDIAWTRRTEGTYLSCFANGSSHLDGNWHHVVAAISSAGMVLYVDGALKCSNNHGNPTLYDKGTDFFVGRHGNLSPDWDFDGNIDDVRIYNRALSASEVAALASGL
jgi:hypothetical protein